MTILYVIRTGQTEWSQQNRVESSVGVPLNSAGAAVLRDIAQELIGLGIQAVYSSRNEADHQTAKIVAKALGLRPHVDRELRELDYGLWQGLRVEDIRQRQAKMYKQWSEAPTTVCPPGGETLEQAQKRILRSLRKILRKHRGQNLLIVQHRAVAGLLRCELLGVDLSGIWREADAAGAWIAYDLDRFTTMKEDK